MSCLSILCFLIELVPAEEISFGADQRYPLKGTLEFPTTSNMKLLILIPGSGLADQDVSFGKTKIFKQMSDAFVQNGFTVFRFSKRQFTYRNELHKEHLNFYEEIINDALDALKVLSFHPQLQNFKTYIIGHSLGATLCPLLASLHGHIHGIVLLAATCRDPFVLLEEQLEFLSISLPAKREYYLSKIRELNTIRRKIGIHKAKPDDLFLGQPLTYWAEWKKEALQSLDIASQLKMPIFIAGFGYDYHVSNKDFLRYQQTLSKKQKASFHWYPDLNHFFIKVKNKETFMDKTKEYQVSPKLIQDLSRWMNSSLN